MNSIQFPFSNHTRKNDFVEYVIFIRFNQYIQIMIEYFRLGAENQKIKTQPPGALRLCVEYKYQIRPTLFRVGFRLTETLL